MIDDNNIHNHELVQDFDFENIINAFCKRIPASPSEKELIGNALRCYFNDVLKVKNLPQQINKKLGSFNSSIKGLSQVCRNLPNIFSAPQLPPWMSTLVEVLDFINRTDITGTKLYAFWPAMFYITDDQKLIIIPQGFEIAGIVDKNSYYNNSFDHQSIRCRMHPEAYRQPQKVNPSAALLYSFALFLAEHIFNIKLPVSRDNIIKSLESVRIKYPKTPIPLPNILIDALSHSVTSLPPLSCSDLIKTIHKLYLLENNEVKNQVVNSITHQFAVNTAIGRKKLQNEDLYIIKSVKECPDLAILAVADGVSTADIGTGFLAAQNIYDTFYTNWLPSFIKKAKQWHELGSKLTPQIFEKESIEQLQALFEDAHQAVVNKTNQLYQTYYQHSDHSYQNNIKSLSPMASTLTAAIVYKNRAVVASVGDSPCFLYSNREHWGLVKVTVDQCNSTFNQKGYDFEDHDALTMAIGLCLPNQSHQSWEPVKLEIQFYSLNLLPSDILILASDGLVKCITGPDSPEKMIENTIRREIEGNKNVDLSNLVRALTRLGNEKGSGHDNITCVALMVTDKEQNHA